MKKFFYIGLVGLSALTSCASLVEMNAKYDDEVYGSPKGKRDLIIDSSAYKQKSSSQNSDYRSPYYYNNEQNDSQIPDNRNFDTIQNYYMSRNYVPNDSAIDNSDQPVVTNNTYYNNYYNDDDYYYTRRVLGFRSPYLGCYNDYSYDPYYSYGYYDYGYNGFCSTPYYTPYYRNYWWWGIGIGPFYFYNHNYFNKHHYSYYSNNDYDRPSQSVTHRAGAGNGYTSGYSKRYVSGQSTGTTVKSSYEAPATVDNRYTRAARSRYYYDRQSGNSEPQVAKPEQKESTPPPVQNQSSTRSGYGRPSSSSSDNYSTQTNRDRSSRGSVWRNQDSQTSTESGSQGSSSRSGSRYSSGTSGAGSSSSGYTRPSSSYGGGRSSGGSSSGSFGSGGGSGSGGRSGSARSHR